MLPESRRADVFGIATEAAVSCYPASLQAVAMLPEFKGISCSLSIFQQEI